MSFSDNLRKYRKKMDWTQEELSRRLNVTQKAVSSWEVGRTEPTMGDVIKLCDLFDCTIEDLTGTRTRRTGEISLEDIYVYLSKLKIDQLKTLKNEIEYHIEYLTETEKIERERRELQKQLSEVQKKMNKMKKLSEYHNSIYE